MIMRYAMFFNNPLFKKVSNLRFYSSKPIKVRITTNELKLKMI